MPGALRTQIYLTVEQRARLDELREREGKSLAELVREALDAYVAEQAVDAADALDSTFGAAPGFTVPERDEWDRG
jgi:predicted DNA-binding protein